MRWLVALFGSVVVLTAGCGPAAKAPENAAVEASAAPSSAGPSSPAASASASTPPPFDRAQVAEQTKRVLMAHGALVAVGAPGRGRDVLDGEYGTSDFCNQTVRNEGRSGHVAHLRGWKTSGLEIVSTAHGFNVRTGAQAVADARANSAKCKTYQQNYQDGLTVKYELLDVVDLGAVAGVDDSFAICDKRTLSNGNSNVACSAYLGRNHLASVVKVYVPAQVSTARSKLLRVVPIAAAALTAAA
jgi:hypothetical protein